MPPQVIRFLRQFCSIACGHELHLRKFGRNCFTFKARWIFQDWSETRFAPETHLLVQVSSVWSVFRCAVQSVLSKSSLQKTIDTLAVHVDQLFFLSNGSSLFNWREYFHFLQKSNFSSVAEIEYCVRISARVTGGRRSRRLKQVVFLLV